MRLQPSSCLRAFLLLSLTLLALTPQVAYTQSSTAQPGDASETGASSGAATGDASGTASAKAARAEDMPVSTTPSQAKKHNIGPILTGTGITIAALASSAALIFAILGWRRASNVQKSIDGAASTASQTLSRLPANLSLTILNDSTLLKALNNDLTNLPQKIVDKIGPVGRNSGSHLLPVPTTTSNGPSEVSAEQISLLVQRVITPLSEKIGQVANYNRIVLDEVQNLRRQLDPQIDPPPASLSALLAQAADPSDALVQAGQKLQNTFQKLGSGGQIEGYFLDNLAQTVYIPLSVPLAPLNLTEAQTSYRLNLLGAIERTRTRAATQLRQSGLEIMPVEVSKTAFDGNRHDAMLGTEIRTDRAELSGKVAEVLKHGFLQKNKDGTLKVVRKAQVRLFLQTQPKAVAPPHLPPPAAVRELPAEVPVVVPKPRTVPEIVPEPVTHTATATPVLEVKTEAEAGEQLPAPVLSPSLEPSLIEMPPETAQDVPTAREQIEAYRGISSASLSTADWENLSETLTVLYREEAMDASTLDQILSSVFPDRSPRCIMPQLGEVKKPIYTAEPNDPEGIVAEVLRVGIDLSRDGSINRPVAPLVRLAPK